MTERRNRSYGTRSHSIHQRSVPEPKTSERPHGIGNGPGAAVRLDEEKLSDMHDEASKLVARRSVGIQRTLRDSMERSESIDNT